MAHKSGSQKKAARRAREARDTEQLTSNIQEPKDSAPISTENSITHADDVVQATPPQISSAPVDPFENMVLEQRARDRTKGGTHRPRVELLRNSITNTLRLLHDYQQYKYQRRDLTQTELAVFRECKKGLWQTLDCVPVWTYLCNDECVDATRPLSPPPRSSLYY